MAGGNQLRLRSSPYRTCRFAKTLRRVYTTWGVLWASVTSIDTTSTITYSSAPLTDLIKQTTPWRWSATEEECFQELKKKIASSNCLGVPRPQGDIVLITDASDVGGVGTIYRWQEPNPAEVTHCHYRTSRLNRDGSLKHDYPTSEWRLVRLRHSNWKWNQACSNYSTYDQELLGGMLVLSSQSRLLRSNPIVWLCDQESVKSIQKGPPPEKAKLKRLWTYLSQFRLQSIISLL